MSGDHFTFTFEINRGTHIYVINRTELRGPAAVSAGYQAKRITRPQTVSHSEPLSDPRLLFPTHRAGVNNHLSADVPREIPHKGYFAMDDDSGTEKLYVVISDRGLNFGEFFDSATDRVKQRHGSPDSRIVARLEARLAEWKKNAAVELVPKGIVLEVDSYGVSIDPSKPAMVEIDLKHYR